MARGRERERANTIAALCTQPERGACVRARTHRTTMRAQHHAPSRCAAAIRVRTRATESHWVSFEAVRSILVVWHGWGGGVRWGAGRLVLALSRLEGRNDPNLAGRCLGPCPYHQFFALTSPSPPLRFGHSLLFCSLSQSLSLIIILHFSPLKLAPCVLPL